MRVLVVDDHALSRVGLATVLMANQVIVEPASDLEDGARLVSAQSDIGLVFVDHGVWHGRRDCEPYFSFGAIFPGVPVVVTRGTPDPAEAKRAQATGAVGYLPRNAELADLQVILKQLLPPEEAPRPSFEGSFAPGGARGTGHAAPELRTVQEGDSGDETEYVLCLTAREREVVELLLNGKTNKEIGRILSLSDGTIKAHVHKILRKAGVRNRIELVQKMSGRAL